VPRAVSLALKRDCLLVCSSLVLAVFVLLANRAGHDFMSPVQIRFFLISSGAADSFLRVSGLAHIFDFSLTFFVSLRAGQISFFWSRLSGATSDSACDSLLPSAQG
jgi:hypothetical protein